MKARSAIPIFSLSFFTTKPPQIFQKLHYLSFYTQTQQNPSPSHHPRRQEDDRRSVPVSVWWDFENCHLPLNTNVFRVGQSITNAVRANRINGPIQITAFGDVMQISRTNQEALSSTGITLIHVPSGGKNSADRSLLVHLMCWVSENPPPAHLFVISGDRDFASILHKLRMNNYNILLASPDSAPSVLCCAATIMWQWSSLLKGENLTGKLFNHPPDGPYNSLYGHYKAPLEDPFAISEQSSCANADESKIRPIPKVVVNHVCQVLDLYPGGVSISQLRTELSNKSNLTIDRDLYGYKKFSRFLLAMSHVLKLHSGIDGHFVVRRVEPARESDVGGFKTGGENGLFEDASEKTVLPPAVEPRLKAQPSNLVEAPKEEKQNEFSSSTNMQGMKTSAHVTNSQDVKKEEKRKEINPKRRTQEVRGQDRKVKVPEQAEKAIVDGNNDFSEKTENQMLVVNTRGSDSEIGIIRRTWMKLFRSGDVSHKDIQKDERKDISDEKTLGPALFSPSSHEALIYRKSDGTNNDVNDASSRDISFLNLIMSWFRFSSSREIDDKLERNGEAEDIVKVSNPNEVYIFSRESFWKEVESFIDTPEGSAIFTQSRTREYLVQNLQKHGPPSLKSLSKTEILSFIDFLISDKKWVEECNSGTSPFRLARPSAINNPPSNPNGLSQIFSGKHLNLPESGERKHHNPPHTGVPQHVVHKNLSSKTRSELLADCQKLVDHIVKNHPEGFNLGSFRKLFLEKNGYALDLQKLGYEKLANLLQIMPGLRIESNHIFPAGPFKIPDSESLTRSSKDDDLDSSWDELGPVDNPGRDKEKTDLRLTRKRPDYDYTPVKDDDFSDSEDEALENEVNKTKLEDGGSLLQILDSWYSNKDSGGKKDESMGVNVLTDKGQVFSQPSGQMGSGLINGTSVVGPKRKQIKSYTFVSEQDVGSQDKLVNGILGNLKKSGERSGDSRVLG
ncbi:hypothetical protein OROMI_005301 [Orobanche minor]